ncbi:unnamed protein product [Trypanosoma congolense IL3000]|uniref:WGS project CAEQ00000000 data, annotated contig 733 n=1 Tax=Trypanosoma congolense (strain IL3000) TaxID=1068625 RepID=F9WI56_TRYCI|nr:unnamed protein product [Trypanosoma congolense IL3000]
MSADSLESSYTESPLIATPCGTLNYAAPETVRSLTQSSQLATTAELLPRMDVYAVGAVLYVMLSGKLPFHHSGNKMQLVKVMEAGPLFEETRWRNAPREAIELTRALLNFDPAKRPEAAEALRYEWLCSEEKVGEVSNDSTRNGVSTDGSDCWVTPTPQVASDDELLRRGFDGLRQPEGSLYDTGNGGIAACGWCISVPFGAPRQTVPSYFGFCQ